MAQHSCRGPVAEAAAIVADLQDETAVVVGIEGERIVGPFFQPEFPVLPGSAQCPQPDAGQVVLEDNRTFKQRQPGRDVTPCMDPDRRRVLEPAQRQLLASQPLQEIDHRHRTRSGDPERHCVEKQTDHFLCTAEEPTTCPRRPEHHIMATAELLEQNAPGGLDNVVRGDLLLAGQQFQRRCRVFGKLGPGCRQDIFIGAGDANRVDTERGGCRYARESAAPERLRHRDVLLNQPADIVPVRASTRQIGPAPGAEMVVHVEQLGNHHEKRTPVHQRVMGRPDKFVLVVATAEDSESHRRTSGKIEDPAPVPREIGA